MMWRPLPLLLLFGTALVGFFGTGCTGEEGPAGRDGTGVDNVPPVVALDHPAAGSTHADTLLAVARATDNTGVVERVEFYFDGSLMVDDTTYAIVDEAPFRYEFDLARMDPANGAHTLMARAYDAAGNEGVSATILVYTRRTVPPGPALLRPAAWDTTSAWEIPLRDVVSGDALDTLYHTRFTPERRATFDSLRLYLEVPDNPADRIHDRPLRIGLHRSTGFAPADTITTTLLQIAGQDTAGWRTVIFPLTPTFDEGEPFHVSVSVDSTSDTTSVLLGVSVIDRYRFAAENRSGFYYRDPDGFARWVTFQGYRPAANPLTYELMLEAYVTYTP